MILFGSILIGLCSAILVIAIGGTVLASIYNDTVQVVVAIVFVCVAAVASILAGNWIYTTAMTDERDRAIVEQAVNDLKVSEQISITDLYSNGYVTLSDGSVLVYDKDAQTVTVKK